MNARNLDNELFVFAMRASTICLFFVTGEREREGGGKKVGAWIKISFCIRYPHKYVFVANNTTWQKRIKCCHNSCDSLDFSLTGAGA